MLKEGDSVWWESYGTRKYGTVTRINEGLVWVSYEYHGKNRVVWLHRLSVNLDKEGV